MEEQALKYLLATGRASSWGVRVPAADSDALMWIHLSWPQPEPNKCILDHLYVIKMNQQDFNTDLKIWEELDTLWLQISENKIRLKHCEKDFTTDAAADDTGRSPAVRTAAHPHAAGVGRTGPPPVFFSCSFAGQTVGKQRKQLWRPKADPFIWTCSHLLCDSSNWTKTIWLISLKKKRHSQNFSSQKSLFSMF